MDLKIPDIKTIFFYASILIAVAGLTLLGGIRVIKFLVQTIKNAGIKKIYGVELDTDRKELGNETSISPHDGCTYELDVIKLLTDQKQVLEECHKLEMSALSENIAAAMVLKKRIRSAAQKVFLTLLKEKLGGQRNGLVTHPDYREYIHVLRDEIDDAYDVIVGEVWKNHFWSKSDSEYTRYYMDLCEGLLLAMTEELNEAYIGEVVTREEIYDRNQIHMPEFKAIAYDFFRDIRRNSIDMHEKTVRLEEGFNSYADRLLPKRTIFRAAEQA